MTNVLMQHSSIRSNCGNLRLPTVVVGLLLMWMVIGIACFGQDPGPEQSGQLGVRAREVYQAAKLVPDDVGVFVCFLDADEGLEILLESDIGDGAVAFYDRSNGGRMWREVAADFGLPPQVLFDLILGKRLVLVSEGIQEAAAADAEAIPVLDDGEDEARALPTWVALASTTRAEFRQLHKQLDGKVARWLDNTTAVYASQLEAGLLFSFRDGILFISDKSGEEFFDKIVSGHFHRSLADVRGFQESLAEEAGQVTFFAQEVEEPAAAGERPKGEMVVNGWVGMNVEIAPSGMVIRSTTREGSRRLIPPVEDPNQRFGSGLDVNVLEQINDGALLVMVERLGTEPASALGSTAITSAFVRKQRGVLLYAGPTIFTVVEARDKPVVLEGNVEEQLAGMLETPVQQIHVTWGVELKKPWRKATRQMDELFISSLDALKLCVDDPEQLKIPRGADSESGRINSVDLTGCSKTMLETLPGLERLELHWSVVNDGERAWWVCATDIEMFTKVSDRLKGMKRVAGIKNEDALGVIDGPAAAALLDSWQEVNAGTEHPLFSRLFYLEEMLKAIPRIHWVVEEGADEERTETTIRVDWGF